MEIKDIEHKVYSFQTKHKDGFTGDEMQEFIKEMSFDPEQFYTTLGINTGMIIDGDFITYHCDVLTAAICTSENRDKTIYEWD